MGFRNWRPRAKYNLHLSSRVPCLQSKSVWIDHRTAISETKVVHTQKKYGEHTDTLAKKGLMDLGCLGGGYCNQILKQD